MQQRSERARLFSRRAMMLAGGQAALFGTLAARLYYLQIIESERYATLAEGNRVSARLLLPPRGLILDRNGVSMATNQHNYRVLLVAEQAPSLDYALDALGSVIPLGPAERSRLHKDVRRHRSFTPLLVRENLSLEDVSRIEANAPHLPGVMIDVGSSRYYPLMDLGAHILGYVAPIAEADLTGDQLELQPGFRAGKDGVERIYDKALRGRAGTVSVEVNALGRVIRELDRQESEPGHDLAMTLDMNLQAYAAQRLGEESAAVVVMDIHSGDVLVLASTPSFDPNAFTRGLTTAEWKSLSTDPRSPLSNKAIAGTFAPGSTFKIVVALAALEHKVITPEQIVFCRGHTELGSARFHCWKKGGHGGVNMHNGLKLSCDIYFYEIARRLGVDKINDMARRLGMDGLTGIDLPNERPGVVPSQAWKRRILKQPWHPGESLITGIGQGYVLATPLQLAVMTARLANGGKQVVPHVTRDAVDGQDVAPRPAPDWASCNIDPKHIAVVRGGMNGVSNEPGGTAYRSRIQDPEMALSGKTGTAQVRRISMSERNTGVRRNDELPWKERDHALFVAYAPEHNPKYAIAVVVEHGGGGSAVAAPIARDIMIEVQRAEKRRQKILSKGDGG